MRLHLACVSSGTYGPFATSASRSRLRLPRTTRLALRASLAGSEGGKDRGILNHYRIDSQDSRDSSFLFPDFVCRRIRWSGKSATGFYAGRLRRLFSTFDGEHR